MKLISQLVYEILQVHFSDVNWYVDWVPEEEREVLPIGRITELRMSETNWASDNPVSRETVLQIDVWGKQDIYYELDSALRHYGCYMTDSLIDSDPDLNYEPRIVKRYLVGSTINNELMVNLEENKKGDS